MQYSIWETYSNVIVSHLSMRQFNVYSQIAHFSSSIDTIRNVTICTAPQ